MRTFNMLVGKRKEFDAIIIETTGLVSALQYVVYIYYKWVPWSHFVLHNLFYFTAQRQPIHYIRADLLIFG